MNYVTVKMIAEHAGKTANSVIRALRRAGHAAEVMPGVRGYRVTEKDANNFLRRQWPEAGPLPPLNTKIQSNPIQ